MTRAATVESLRNGFADIKKFKLDFVFKMDMFLMLRGLLGVASPARTFPKWMNVNEPKRKLLIPNSELQKGFFSLREQIDENTKRRSTRYRKSLDL